MVPKCLPLLSNDKLKIIIICPMNLGNSQDLIVIFKHKLTSCHSTKGFVKMK